MPTLVGRTIICLNLLDKYYSTNIKGHEDISIIANYITSINNINKRLENGDLTLVNDIASCTNKKYISFASKFCSHINPDAYPIYDKLVREKLYEYKFEEAIYECSKACANRSRELSK